MVSIVHATIAAYGAVTELWLRRDYYENSPGGLTFSWRPRLDAFIAHTIGYFIYDFSLIVYYGFDENWGTFVNKDGAVRSPLGDSVLSLLLSLSLTGCADDPHPPLHGRLLASGRRNTGTLPRGPFVSECQSVSIALAFLTPLTRVLSHRRRARTTWG